MRLMIGKLDWYIIKKFIGTYFFSIGLIISVAVVFDYAEKMDDFYEHNAPWKAIMFDYYLNFIPFFANMFSSLFIFISVIFFTSKLAYNTEIVAALAAGVSFKRLLWPYFLSALFIGSLSFVLSGYVIPPANKKRLEFEWTYIKPNYSNKEVDFHRQIEPGVFIYVSNYNTYSDIAHKFSVEKFDNGRLHSKIMCDYAKWDTTKNKWALRNYYLRKFDESGKEVVEAGHVLDTALNITPKDFKIRAKIVQAMTNSELDDFIEDQKMQGVTNIEEFEIEKYTRWAYPFSTFILTFIGAALSSKKKRGGMGLNIGMGLVLSFAYVLFMRFTTMFAVGGTLSPKFGVWVPNILFMLISILLYRKAPK
jgi:lipopolysaccharide export system permease protein